MCKENREETKVTMTIPENGLRRSLPMNLQLFASAPDNDDVDDDNIDDDNIDGNNDDASSHDDKGSSGSVDDKSKGKTFTQEQVNRMMTREKNQGRNAVYNEFGIDPKDSKMVNMFKAFIESQKTDEQKVAEQEAQRANELQEANERALKAEAKAEAMQLGVKPQYVDDIITLVLAKKTEDADLKTLIGEYKTKYPVWFGSSDDEEESKKDETGKQKAGQKGTGSSVRASGKDKSNDGAKGLGARLAAQRKVSAKKSSYWS